MYKTILGKKLKIIHFSDTYNKADFYKVFKDVVAR